MSCVRVRERERGRYLDVEYIDGLSAALFIVLDLRQLLLPDVAIAAMRIWLRRVSGFFFGGEREIKKTLVLKSFAADASNSQPKAIVGRCS